MKGSLYLNLYRWAKYQTIVADNCHKPWGFFFCHVACGILVPYPGIKPTHPAVKA